MTGASKGIGYATAENFVKAGANVAIVARRPDVLEEARAALRKEGKGKVVASPATSARPTIARGIFATAEKELGRVDVLVNNAGTHQNGPVRGGDRRDLAGRSRPEAVRRDPSVACGAARHEGAQSGAASSTC